MSAYDYGFGPQTPEEEAAMDEAVRLAVFLACRPLTWQERREVKRATAAVRGLLAYEDRRRRGVR